MSAVCGRIDRNKKYTKISFVKFLVDAQLPFELSQWLCEQGHDSIHTRELPKQNRTSDTDLLMLAKNEFRIVITKDSDFVDSFYLKGSPEKLLLVKTGNVSNTELLKIFVLNHSRIATLFKQHKLLELNKINLIIHR